MRRRPPYHKNIAKLLAAAALVMPLVFLSGCWSYREINTMDIVSGFAVDEGESGGYRLTFELLDFSGSGSKGSVKPKIIETTGSTVFDAVRGAVNITGKKLFFSHCKVVIISEKLARRGVAPLFDWVTRDSEPRLSTKFVVSRESTAAEILRQEAVSDNIVSYELDQSLRGNPHYLSEAPLVKLYQANNLLYGGGVSLSLPAVGILRMDGSATPELNGTAFFEGDRLAGFLSRQETVWFNFAAGKVKGGLITVSDGSAGPPDSIAFEIISSTTKVTPHLGADGASADVSIKTVCSLCETGAFTKCSGDKEIAAAAVSARKKISSGVALLIKRMQYEGSDIFGFGRDLHAAYPLKQPGGAKNPDDCFRSMRVNVNVAVTVRDTACVNGGIAESRQ